ncbi:ABC transporter ATP-binding protein [Paenibacillus cymbidii]|uniref:ABC transporter ATP-binding protein n=1 Tax=Paenibacillus cymbidii TaxID=1639034 RepID=UPI0010803CD0|nr:ABC transporter ATP-binding protein [Paenibacillus cymbidii]
MIECEELVKIYKSEATEVVALQGLSLRVEAGELMAIIGSSGSGKSTLLSILGGLDRPSAGKVRVAERDLLRATEIELVRYKRHAVGFVWQNNARNLLPYLSALENVETAMMLAGRVDRAYALQLLERVGLGHRVRSKLRQLSGGEQQRVAIAIALANRPPLLLADEPTGSVDSATSDLIMQLFRRLNRELGVTIVIVTHDLSLARQVDRVVAIRDGLTSAELIRPSVRRTTGETALAEAASVSHDEFVVLDRVGRLQVPAAMLEALGISGKAHLELDGDKIVIRPPKRP